MGHPLECTHLGPVSHNFTYKILHILDTLYNVQCSPNFVKISNNYIIVEHPVEIMTSNSIIVGHPVE